MALIGLGMLYSCGNTISDEDMKALIKTKVKNCTSVIKVDSNGPWEDHYVAVDSSYNMYIFTDNGNEISKNGEPTEE